ncbi:MAG TPA: ATP-binding protein, partial [Thermodesulfobacteriota bacterium]|nr:ATP-binding protein [Thermodesulfobacteriota bacterium]
EQEISRPLKITMYRLLQEALTNIVKHSQASLVTISLVKKQKRIELSIRDNGKGFALDTTNYRDASVRGLGLTNMNERTILSGGVFRIESEPGAGTLIKASWPLESLQQND